MKFGQDSVSLRSAVVTSTLYAGVDNFNFAFENRAQFRRDLSMESALAADIEYAQNKLDEIDGTTKEMVSGQPRNMTKEEFRVFVAQGGESSRELRDNMFSEGSQLADTIYLSFDITPEQDLVSTFAAVLVTYAQLDQSGDPVGRFGKPSLVKTGDLKAKIPNQVEFQIQTNEQLLSNLDIKVFLFTNDGLPIATNASGKIKGVSAEELEAVRAELATLP